MASCDLAIVGGGPVGLFLCAIAGRAGLRSVVFESRSAARDSEDRRTIALSWGSALKLARAGADPREHPATSAIRGIHVSQARQPGRAFLSADDAGVPMLGLTIAYGDLVSRLASAAAVEGEIRYETPVLGVEPGATGATVCWDAGHLEVPAVVIADGGTALLESARFPVTARDYGVHAVVARVSTGVRPGDIAFERFSAAGPIALLPRGDEYALIWTVESGAADELVQCDPKSFLSRLQTEFGWRAGRFEAVRDRGAFPLVARASARAVNGRTAVVGNAAQTLHPVAGQGLNLGLRDAWALVAALAARRDDPAAALSAYEASRRSDRLLTMRFTDLLARAFTWPGPIASTMRSFALEILDLAPAARTGFAHQLSVTPQR